MKPQPTIIAFLTILSTIAPSATVWATSISRINSPNSDHPSIALAPQENSILLSQENSPNSRMAAAIAVALVKVGQYERALDVAQMITDEALKVFALREIAILLADEGQTEQATEILDRAIVLLGL